MLIIQILKNLIVYLSYPLGKKKIAELCKKYKEKKLFLNHFKDQNKFVFLLLGLLIQLRE